MEKDTSVIPPGIYCYTLDKVVYNEDPTKPPVLKTKVCPYWSSHPEHGSQNDGHCSFLDRGDWQDDGFSLLWDQVKECGINDDHSEDLIQVDVPPGL